MKITKSQLKKIIKEELKKVIGEADQQAFIDCQSKVPRKYGYDSPEFKDCEKDPQGYKPPADELNEGLGDWVKGLFSGNAKPTREPSLPEWFGKRPPTQEEAYALIMSPDPGGRRMKAMQQASIDILQDKAKSGKGLSMDEKVLAQMMQADLMGASDEEFMKMTDRMGDEALASLPPSMRAQFK